MADTNDTKRDDLPNPEDNPGGNDKELEDILGKITETSRRGAPSRQTTPENEEIIKLPKGLDDQPEDLEGIIEKISEKPSPATAGRPGFFQRLLNWFKKS